MDKERLIVIGRFGAPFGVKGWMKIHAFTEDTDDILQYQPWFADFKTGLTEVKILGHRKHHNGIIAQVEGCDTKEDTVRFRNVNIAVKRSTFPELEDDEYYWTDLVGLTVSNTAGVTLGKIDHIMPTGANDVLVLKGDKEILIPYVKNKVIKQVDLENKTMIVDWEPDY